MQHLDIRIYVKLFKLIWEKKSIYHYRFYISFLFLHFFTLVTFFFIIFVILTILIYFAIILVKLQII